MKQVAVILGIIIILAACAGKKAKPVAAAKPDVSALYSWQTGDTALQTAVKQARSTLDSFTIALQSNNTALGNFAVKIRFPGLGGAEDVWVNNIKITPAGFTGSVNNAPRLTTAAKMGSPIKFTKENISDWMYTDNGKLRGGFTIKLGYSRMTVKEKAKFDTAFVFKME